jgi:hypothetical protein
MPSVKHGGGHAVVWGCMGYAGVGELAIVEGIMNAKGYVNILRGNLKKCSEIRDPRLVFVSTR